MVPHRPQPATAAFSGYPKNASVVRVQDSRVLGALAIIAETCLMCEGPT
jgi:hypothetical protein